jgi:polysaccharide chain length determinant protein (PEP-CTERM system associated)
MNLDLSFYVAVFLRRIHYFIIITALVSAAALAAAFLLPPSYDARSVLLVESPVIPNQLAAPTVQTAAMEQLQVIEQRLMTRANLLEIANRLNVFADLDKMAPDDIVMAMRDHTNIDKRAGREQATVMEITFNAESGKVAADVVNAYVTLIQQENLALRTERAGQTLEFFEQEVASLGAELDAMSAKILDFQNANRDALPNTLNFRLTQQTMLQGQLSTAERDIAALRDQKERLIAVFNTTGVVSTATNIPQTPEAKQLAQAQDALRQALAVYAPTNPKVRMIEANIKALEEIVRNQSPATAADVAAANPAATMLDVQIADIDSQVEVLENQRKTLDEQLATLTESIDATANNQIALDALMRDYSNIQQQYNTAQSRLSAAATGERIEITSKGERITLIEAASVPNRPTKPNRLLIAAGGIVGGILLGIASIILIEVLNRSVRRPKDLIAAFGITPLTTIPYMRTPSETVLRRGAFAGMLLVAVVGIPALIYAVHVYYQPLDLILSRFAARFGLSL